MTEDQLRAIREFGSLPIYDDADDAGCNTLDPIRVGDTRYEGAVSEVDDEAQFWNLLRDKRYDLKGAIRYSAAAVRPIFWLKRSDGT